jgi:pyruvate/2-oxoglutarate dehydrogenase complex dihydrolipoamide dehydrogenase (E3) component
MRGRYDLVVIGGGSGGLVSALIAAAAGARVALVERDRTGGDCLWTGCVPSKSLIAAADLAHRIRTANTLGLEPREPEIDFARVMERVLAARRAIEPQDSPERLRRAGVEVISGAAAFEAPGVIRAGMRELRYRTAIVATGSEPSLPPLPGLAEADPLTSETLWDLRELPGRLLVLGGGPVGCELGQAFARLGSRVTIVEKEPRLLLKEEPQASELVAACLRADGVDVRTSAAPVEARAGRELALEGGETLPYDRLLVTAGRRPRSSGLGLDRVGVSTDGDGAVLVDDRLRTTGRNIYAVGDVTGGLPLTHVAAYHARVATVNALFRARGRVDYSAVPEVTFTDPEVGRVGLTEHQARERLGDRVSVAAFDYSELDRAITAGRPYGFAKLVADAKGRLVGATVAAPAGGEAIAELAAWVVTRSKLERVSRTVHAYPTMAEGPARAADGYLLSRLSGGGIGKLSRAALAAMRILDRPS